MGIETYEQGVDLGAPIELFEFVYGEAGQAFRYTDADTDQTYGGETYTAVAVSRAKIETDGKLDGREVQIEVPIDSDVAELFRIFPPGRVVNAIIRQGHEGDPDNEFPVAWTGRVLEALRGEAETTLVCEALSAGMRRPGLRRHYQWSCPLALYGPRCGATKTAIPAVVDSIAGNQITLVSGWEGVYLPTNFTGGLIEWVTDTGTESRGVLRIEGTDTVVISGVPLGLEAGDVVDVFLGCPHTLTGCADLHNNVQNYGGQPWIPDGINPFGKNNHT